MLLRLSRLTSWLAAAAGGLALFGPLALRALCTDIALALAATAFVLWRAALALHRRLEHPGDAVPDAVPLDAASLGDAQALVARRVAEAASFEVALHGAADTLRGELGARAARVFLVHSDAAGLAVSELIAARPGFRTPRRAVALDDTALGRALREQRPCIDLPRALVVPVLHDGSPVALLELLGIDMTIDEHALAQLLGAAQQALGERGAPTAPVAARAPRASAVAWSGAFGGRADSGGCAC